MARLSVLIAALLFSTGGTAIKLASLTSWQIAGFRSAVAALVLWLAIPAWRGWPGPGGLLVALAYGATLVLFVSANTLTTAAAAIFLQTSAPLYVLVLAPRLLGERARPGDVAVIVLIASGLALFFAGAEAPQTTAPDPATGSWIGAASGVTWGLTVIGLRWLARTGRPAASDPTGSAIVLGNALAFLACAPLALPVAALAPVDAAVVVYLGAFQIGLAYVFLVRGVRGTRALDVSLLLVLEPVLSALWAWWVHAELPGATSAAGCGLILAGVLLQTLRAARPA